MSQTAFSGVHLLVEGPLDSKFWASQVVSGSCQPVICWGRTVVLEAIYLLNNKKVSKVVGVIDDDLDRFVNRANSLQNLYVTDDRDLEAMIFGSDAAARVISSIATPEKLTEFIRQYGPVTDAIITRTLPFGRMHLLEQVHQFGVSFKAMRPPRYIANDKSWALDENRLISDVAAKLQSSVADYNKLLAEVPVSPAWHIIRGHDAVMVLNICLRVCFDFKVSNEALCAMLLLAFTSFPRTQLFSNIRNWERMNGFSILV